MDFTQIPMFSNQVQIILKRWCVDFNKLVLLFETKHIIRNSYCSLGCFENSSEKKKKRPVGNSLTGNIF